MAKRKFKGNHPETGEIWWNVGTIIQDNGVAWTVYQRDGEPWNCVKVCADQPVVAKANYWLGIKDNRLGRNPDYVKMSVHRPDLLKLVKKLLRPVQE